VFGALGGVLRPWYGVLVLAILGYLNPHRYAWGFVRDIPIYFVVFSATAVGILINEKERQPFPWTRETILFVLLLIWFTVTTLLTPDVPHAAKDQWIKVMKIYAGIFPTFFLINSKEKLKWLIITIALSFGLIGMKGGIFALATGFNYRVWGPDNTFYGGNNEIALALNITLPLLILCAKEFKNKRVKAFFYGTFILSICSVIASRSRGAFLTLCAVLFALIVTSKRKRLAVPVLLIGLILFVPRLPDVWTARMETLHNIEEDASAMGRIGAWKYAYHRALANPVTGGGFETFRMYVRDVHSAYFEILGEHGFVALTFWISLLFGTMIALERLRKQALSIEELQWMPAYARAVQLSLFAYAVGGAFLGAAYWDIFYHLVSLCVIMKVLLHKETATEASVLGQAAVAV
jgi:probable O-glycosylation ligase (exosortase A-associated)